MLIFAVCYMIQDMVKGMYKMCMWTRVGGRNHAVTRPDSTFQSGANASRVARQNCAFGVPEGAVGG